MQLTWYGTAALILKEDDTSIGFDPFCGLGLHESLRSEDLFPGEQEFRKIEHVFLTHGHFDHVGRIPAIYKKASVKLWCTWTPYNVMLQKGMEPGQMQVIRPGERIPVGPFTVTAYQSRHCRFDVPLMVKTIVRPKSFSHPVHLFYLLNMLLAYPEKNEILLYEVSCKDKRIQIMGSLNLAAGVNYPTGADMLILPFQGRSDLERWGLSIVRRLKPRTVFLDHYDDAFPPLSDHISTKKFETILWEQEKIPCRVLKKGEMVYG